MTLETCRRELEELHARLNRDSVVDPVWYRRSSPVYECVCYINNLVAAYCSANHEVMTIFLRRAYEWLTTSPHRTLMPGSSRSALLHYLATVTKFLRAVDAAPGTRPD